MNVYLILLKKQDLVRILASKRCVRIILMNKFLHIIILIQCGTSFDSLADIIKDNIDIFMISETKVDDSFPDGQVFIDGFGAPFRLDRNRNGGGIMRFFRNDNPAKLFLQMIGLLKVFMQS